MSGRGSSVSRGRWEGGEAQPNLHEAREGHQTTLVAQLLPSLKRPDGVSAILRLFGNMLINFQMSILQSRCATLGCKPSSEEQVCYNVSSSGSEASWRLELSRGQGADAI